MKLLFRRVIQLGPNPTFRGLELDSRGGNKDSDVRLDSVLADFDDWRDAGKDAVISFQEVTAVIKVIDLGMATKSHRSW